MTRRCGNQDCFVHEGESCPLGESPAEGCADWLDGNETAGEVPQPEAEVAVSVPWSGAALGTSDLFNLFSYRRPVMIAVVGAHDTGKTTILVGCYLAMMKGATLGGASFSGSKTLEAWESLAAWVRLEKGSPSFPPHTPRGTGRVPGLLHVALRNSSHAQRDVIFTDAPGEWFSSWAVNEEAEDASGARWIATNADALVIVADSKRLAGPERGSARKELRQLVERLGRHVGARPVVFVWAKSDERPAEAIKESIRAALREHLPHAQETECTTNVPATLSEAVGSAVEQAWDAAPFGRSLVIPRGTALPFNAYRGHHE
ncbi:hypothetical protein LMG24235_08279 [Paraburkholderia sabiae]|nr:hypothetical protein LMG24235_08279 [Paraburkholderia sabiae]